MSSPSSPSAVPPRKLDWLAALLSYLLPGLGQVLQGRIAKGVVYFVGLYGLFFYGMWMGQMKNVWLPPTDDLPPARLPLIGTELPGLSKAIYHRPQFAGQFWIGAAAWPAILQYFAHDPPADPNADADPAPVVGYYMQAPTEFELNRLQREGDKRFDLGWVYTVIAGVLNILVIYDALAGPVVRDEETSPRSTSPDGPPEAGS